MIDFHGISEKANHWDIRIIRNVNVNNKKKVIPRFEWLKPEIVKFFHQHSPTTYTTYIVGVLPPAVTETRLCDSRQCRGDRRQSGSRSRGTGRGGSLDHEIHRKLAIKQWGLWCTCIYIWLIYIYTYVYIYIYIYTFNIIYIYIYIYGYESKWKAPIHTLNPQADPYPRSIPKRRWSRPIHTSGSPRADPYPNFEATPYIYNILYIWVVIYVDYDRLCIVILFLLRCQLRNM